MEYRFTKKQNIHIIQVNNLNNVLENRTILDKVETLIAQGFHHFIIDFSKLAYMSSIGIGFIIAIYNKANENHGKTLLLKVPDSVKELLVITKLNDVFNSFETVEDAIASIQNNDKPLNNTKLDNN